MNLEKLSTMVYRIFFVGSFLLLTIAGLEHVLSMFGYTILKSTFYTAARLREFAVMFVVFVIALLLRQVREELKKLKT